MTGSPAQPDGRPAADPLAARCRAFGLPLWRFDGGGALAAEPTGWGPAQQWLGSAPLRDLIRESVRGWSQDPPPTFELFAGCWLMPIAEAHRPGGRRLTVAMALAPDVLGTEAFLEICRSGRLETETTRHGIGPLARYDGSDVNQLATALRGVHDDLATAADHDRALDAFSEELALAYEQITLLYELGRSMNWLAKPREFVKTACNLLLGILDFKWIAVKYTTSNPPAPEGSLFRSCGSAP